MVNEVEQNFPTNFIIYANIMSLVMLQIIIYSRPLNMRIKLFLIFVSFCKEEYKVTYDVHNYAMRNILSHLL